MTQVQSSRRRRVRPKDRWTRAIGALLALAAALTATCARADGPSFRRPVDTDNFTISEKLVPMRDGIQLYTLVVSPKIITEPLPILLMRTPYNAKSRIRNFHRTDMAAMLGPSYAELGNYIWVFQDIRGRYKSQGTYQIFRPMRGPFNSSDTDHGTDGWDTVDWLVKHVSGNNGKVGLFGTSYEGWLVLTSLLDPHPAIAAAVPVNPMVDLWMGDDAFHNGAFRQGFMFDYVYRMDMNSSEQNAMPRDDLDLYSWWLRQGSPRAVKDRYLPKSDFLETILQRPAYDAYWQEAAIDRKLRANVKRLVPTLVVHGWFDQEDAYGAPAAYAALEAHDQANDRVFFTAGPWYHGENWSSTSALGDVAWDENTGRKWRQSVLAPFLDHYLKGGKPHGLKNAVVFNTGTLHWEQFEHWPAAEASSARTLYFDSHSSLAFASKAGAATGHDTFVSDPRKPVPYQLRPIKSYYGDDKDRHDWRGWQVADQRFVDGRPDVLTYSSAPFTEAITLRGDAVVSLFASTTGQDADWIVKLIDVYPDQDAAEPEMSGYQLMITGEILRGRYRQGFDSPKPIEPGKPHEYTIRLPQLNHTFKKGHRVMVQVQSSWFPLYDRNPQSWVDNLMDVKEADYMAATHTVFFGGNHASRIRFTVSTGRK